MQIKLKELTKTNIKFTIGSNVSFANSLRRVLIGEVPTVAIDVVEIKENGSSLPDEMVANRMGLMPLHYSGSLLRKEECDCDSFCAKCSIKFELKRSNESDAVISLTGQDFVTTTPGVTCHSTLILYLAPKQKIDIVCIATVGTPQSHAKYCPVAAVGFNYDPRNATRATTLWTEQDVKSEWPKIQQSDELDWGEVEEVEMDVEVVEGMGKPKEILLRALEIYRKKMASLLE